ncbi:MAG: N-ethylammeline chlorohydrolase, partial [Pseudomonadota bacterium]
MSDDPVTVLAADWVIADLPDGRHLLPRGEVAIRSGEIVFVGQDYPGTVCKRRDFGRALIAPGFVDLNALGDLDTTILSFDNHPEWATGRVWPKSYMTRPPYEMYAPDELVFQKRHAFARLIRNGITTAAPIASLFYRAWGETVAEFEGAAEAAEALGLRVYLGPAYRTG